MANPAGSITLPPINPSLATVPTELNRTIPGLPGAVGPVLDNPALAGPPPTTPSGSTACGTGSSPAGSGSTPSSQGTTSGQGTPGADNVVQTQSTAAYTRRAPLSSGLASSINQGLQATDPNLKFVSTSGGQNSSTGFVGSYRHNNGHAADGYFSLNGRRLNGNNPSDRATISSALCNLNKSGIRGVGWGNDYMGGSTFHLDKWGTGDGRNTLVWGNGGRSPNAVPWVVNSMSQSNCPGAAPMANSGSNPASSPTGSNPAASSGNAACAPGTGSGCSTPSTTAATAASSMASGAGLGSPSAFSSLASSLASSVAGGIPSAIQQAIGGVANLTGLGSAAMSLGGLTNQLTQLTAPAASLLGNIGGSIAPSLTGVIPRSISDIGFSGSMTQKVLQQTNDVIKTGTENLGGFPSIINATLGATTSANNIQQLMENSHTKVFGKVSSENKSATDITGADEYFSEFLTPGTEKIAGEGEYDEGLEGLDGVLETFTRSGITENVNLFQPVEEILPSLIEKDFNVFSSIFYDYNSLITHGFGSLTTDLNKLSVDLINLGTLGDLKNPLNLGSPAQIIEQLIESGLGVSSGAQGLLLANGINTFSLYDQNNKEILFEILQKIDDRNVIETVLALWQIQLKNIETLADLVDPEIIFPNSYEYNRFNYLQDIGLFLVTNIKSFGNIKTISDFGYLLQSLETAEYLEDLNSEDTPIRISESEKLIRDSYVRSWFGDSGPTIADFIGTVAGYVHGETFPRMQELYDKVFQNSLLNNYVTLMQLLKDTLNGNYIVSSSIVIPTTAGYNFGTYSSLNSAALAIKNAIESELNYILTYSSQNDQELYQIIVELESLHFTSSNFLKHEDEMRKKYNVDYGNPKRKIKYKGDGSSKSFLIFDNKASGFTILIDRLYQLEDEDWTYNPVTNTIDFVVAPSNGETITILYNNGKIEPSATIVDSWNLANSLETLSKQTGFGGPAEYLNRITTNDVDGQRLRSLMMQSRNRQILENTGIILSDFDKLLDVNTINFVDYTGIWSPDVARAGEIYLQNTQGVESYYQYKIKKLIENKVSIYQDSEILLRNIVRSLLYLDNENVVAGELMAEYYLEDQNNNTSTMTVLPENWVLIYTNNVADGGYILGPYREIISRMMSVEGLNDDYFNINLSAETERYLNSLAVDFTRLVRVIQRLLTNSMAANLGITEGDAIQIFGQPSVTKLLLQNISDNY